MALHIRALSCLLSLSIPKYSKKSLDVREEGDQSPLASLTASSPAHPSGQAVAGSTPAGTKTSMISHRNSDTCFGAAPPTSTRIEEDAGEDDVTSGSPARMQELSRLTSLVATLVCCCISVQTSHVLNSTG